MSLLTGPGRNSEMSVMRSLEGLRRRTCRPARAGPATRSGTCRGCGSTGSARRSPGRRAAPALVVEVDRRRRRPARTSVDRVRHRGLHPDAEHVELEQAERPRRRPCRTGSSGSPSQLASTGVRSSSVGSDSSTPHGCSAMCRGSPSSRSTSRNSRSSRAARRGRWRRSSGRSRSAAVTSLARMCGNALAIASISPGGSPSAAPTSRIACRAR